jgi:flagellar biosynthesis anti-sigma factor FlgM
MPTEIQSPKSSSNIAVLSSNVTKNPDETAIGSDHATLSSAGSEVSQAAHQDGVRMEKLASIQAAIAAGNYDVPAAAVATKVIDALLGGQK